MRIAHFLSGFPVLSETFVLDEIRAFAEAGFENVVVSLRRCQKGCEAPFDLLPKGRTAQDLNLVQCLYPHRTFSPVETSRSSSYPKRDGKASLAAVLMEMITAGVSYPAELPKMFASAIRIGQLASSLRQLGIDHCHAHFAHYPTDLAWGCARLLGIPFSYNAHSYDLWNYQAHKKQRARAADRIFPVSTLNQKHLLEYLTVAADDQKKIQVIRCGIHLDDYPFEPIRARNDPSPPILLGVGRLVDTKGFAGLILAGKILAEQGIKHVIHIIGDGPERQNLEKLAARGCSSSSRVLFSGSLPRAEVRQHQLEASVVVQPCCQGKNGLDGIPVVLMEAMALGTPVVSTQFAAIPELIESGAEGFLVEVGNPLQLAHAIRCMLEDNNLRLSMVHQARKKIEAQFDARKNYRHKVSVIRELLLERNFNSADPEPLG